MLIGGHFYKHVGNGVEESWLHTPNPTAYLLDWHIVYSLMRLWQNEENHGPAEEYIWHLFDRILGMSIPNCFIIEFPWIWDTNEGSQFIIKTSQNPSIIYVPDGKWKEAQVIYTFPREQGIWDKIHALDEAMLRRIITEALDENEQTLREEIELAQNRLGEISEVRTALDDY